MKANKFIRRFLVRLLESTMIAVFIGVPMLCIMATLGNATLNVHPHTAFGAAVIWALDALYIIFAWLCFSE